MKKFYFLSKMFVFLGLYVLLAAIIKYDGTSVYNRISQTKRNHSGVEAFKDICRLSGRFDKWS